MGIKKKYFYIILLSYVLLLLVGFWKVQQDDAYIFYTYAKNIATGNGYVFNYSEKINATTSPLYTIYLAILYYFFQNYISLPLIAHISGAIFLFFTAVFLFKITDKDNLFPFQYVFPILYLTNPLIRNAVGMETSLSLFLVILTFYFYSRDKVILASFIMGLSFLSRFDTILFSSILIMDMLMKRKSMAIKNVILTFTLTIIPWFIFSYIYFNKLLPSSVGIKLLQQSTGYWGNGLIFLKGLITIFPGGKIVALAYISIFSISIAFLIIWRKSLQFQKEIYMMLLGSILYFIVYSFIINPPPYPWYFTPLSLLFALSISMFIKELLGKLQAIPIKIIMLLICILGLILPVKTMLGQPTAKYTAYKKIAEWINERADSSIVAVDEIGVIGFYLNKGKVRDVLGLVNPKAVTYLIHKDFQAFIDYYQPQLIVTDFPDTPKYFKYHIGNKFVKEYSSIKMISTGEKKNILFIKRL